MSNWLIPHCVLQGFLIWIYMELYSFLPNFLIFVGDTGCKYFHFILFFWSTLHNCFHFKLFSPEPMHVRHFIVAFLYLVAAFLEPSGKSVEVAHLIGSLASPAAAAQLQGSDSMFSSFRRRIWASMDCRTGLQSLSPLLRFVVLHFIRLDEKTLCCCPKCFCVYLNHQTV